jgi:carbamoyl-phosphate synthase small subunit
MVHRVWLELEDGTRLCGTSFGHLGPASGEVVFNTSMVGYVESLTDPSYRGQILVLTYPLVGNYGVPAAGDERGFESDRIQAAGLVVTSAVQDKSHAGAARTLGEWLAQEGVPGIEGIDTRHLTLRLRERGTMLGRIVESAKCKVQDAKSGVLSPKSIVHSPESIVQGPFFDPNRVNIVADVSCREPQEFGEGRGKRVILVDCGVKRSIRRELIDCGVRVLQVPFDWDYTGTDFDGILLSNGPGNPEQCGAAISILRRAMARNRPIFGICLGAQLMALAAGAKTYKLRYGHRGQNQPCRETGSDQCRLTSQNHGYAIDAATLPADWQVWFTNANDGSVEGIRHRRRPFSAVQFHPEAKPGPLDSRDLFQRFVEQLDER